MSENTYAARHAGDPRPTTPGRRRHRTGERAGSHPRPARHGAAAGGALAHGRPARRHGLHVAVQPGVRAPAGRPVRAAHRGHRPGPLPRGLREAGLRHPALARPDVGRGPGRRRPVRALPAERAARHLHARTSSGCSPTARPTTAGARPSASPRCARPSRRPSSPPATTGSASARPRTERRALPGFSETPGRADAHPRRRPARVRRPHPRPGLGAAPRRPGDPQGRRVPDLPPRRRRRRPRDGHHPRRARRGVDLLDPQARAALPVARPGAAGVRAHAAAAQHRQVEDLQAQEPRCPAHLVPGAGLPARGAGQLPRAAGLPAGRGCRGRGRRGVQLRGVLAALRLGRRQPGRPDLRPQEARLAQRGAHPRRSRSTTSPHACCPSSRPTACSATTPRSASWRGCAPSPS